MRQAFCDESFSRSPFFVVAGPIIHTDSQLIPVEEYLESLVEKYIPKEDRKGLATPEKAKSNDLAGSSASTLRAISIERLWCSASSAFKQTADATEGS